MAQELAALTALETRLSDEAADEALRASATLQTATLARPRWRWPWADWRRG